MKRIRVTGNKLNINSIPKFNIIIYLRTSNLHYRKYYEL